MKKAWIITGVVILLVIMVLGSIVGSYNKLVALDQGINNSWAQVETVLQRRYDLIPNIFNTVKGYAKHEKDIYEEFATARQLQAGARTQEEKIRASNSMEGFITKLMMVVENYPTLKANENFLSMQDELAGTENRISVERNRYNDAVRQYNTAVKAFPSNIIAKFAGFEPKENYYFKMAEEAKTAPKVDFESTK